MRLGQILGGVIAANQRWRFGDSTKPNQGRSGLTMSKRAKKRRKNQVQPRLTLTEFVRRNLMTFIIAISIFTGIQSRAYS